MSLSRGVNISALTPFPRSSTLVAPSAGTVAIFEATGPCRLLVSGSGASIDVSNNTMDGVTATYVRIAMLELNSSASEPSQIEAIDALSDAASSRVVVTGNSIRHAALQCGENADTSSLVILSILGDGLNEVLLEGRGGSGARLALTDNVISDVTFVPNKFAGASPSCAIAFAAFLIAANIRLSSNASMVLEGNRIERAFANQRQLRWSAAERRTEGISRVSARHEWLRDDRRARAERV